MKPGMFQRFLPVLLVVAHLALWTAAFLTLRNVALYPDHFNIAGKPDSWTDMGWWLLPLIALGMTLLLVGAVFLSRRLAVTSPQWVNLPRKLDWLELPVEARLRAFKPAEGLLLGLAVFMNLTFISITLDTYAIASGAQASLSTAKLVLVLACMVVWLVLSIIRIRQAIGDEVRALRQAQASEPTS